MNENKENKELKLNDMEQVNGGAAKINPVLSGFKPGEKDIPDFDK